MTLKRQWSRVDGAIYCRVPETATATTTSPNGGKQLKFELVANMDLLMEGMGLGPSASDAAHFTDTTLLLTDTSCCSPAHVDTTTYLRENEMVMLPARSCALFPIIDAKRDIVGLFLLSLPSSDPPASTLSPEEMEIVRETRGLLLSAMEQYRDVIRAHQSVEKQRRFTKSILQEGKGAVKSVRSYAKMLSFRRMTGTYEKDMIHGIEHQGERMSDVVQRLETALTADPKHLPVFSPFKSDALSVRPPLSPSYLDN